MAETVTLELSEKLARQAKEFAAVTHRRLEDVLIEWIEHSIAEFPVESLSDEQVLALCDLQMEPEQQEILDDLLAQNREGQLDDIKIRQLDKLMQIYRRGLVRKARAWKVAVGRGLRPPLN